MSGRSFLSSNIAIVFDLPDVNLEITSTLSFCYNENVYKVVHNYLESVVILYSAKCIWSPLSY